MRHGQIATVAVLALVSVTGGPAGATNRYYPNLVETSPDGKLRLEAKSPSNTRGLNGAFAANFVYTLYDSASSKVVWTRAQPKSDQFGVQEKPEGSPMAAFVHDSGAVVVWTGFDYLMVLDAKGTVALEVSILDSIPVAEQQKYVRESTAGPLWSGNSHWYYFTANGKLHFGIRTWWDRRVLVCIPDAKQVVDEGPVREAAAAAEREHALSTLRKASEVAKQLAAKGFPAFSYQTGGTWREHRGLWAAITLAQRMGLKEAVPFLLDLEKVSEFNGSCFGGGDEAPEGQLFVCSYSYDSRRTAVQLAIRRLEGTPLALPTKEMIVAKADNRWGDGYRPKRHDTPRSTRVALVTKAMGAKGVVDAVGEPDYIFSGGGIGEDSWEYDIDAATPFTFRVVWKDNRMVRTERVEPPVWKDGAIRDMQDR
jgi:hypothetical protein